MRPVTAFFGTPHAALPTLAALHAATDLKMVVSRPDAIRGRGRTPTPSPVAAWALEHDVPLHRPTGRGALVAVDLTGIDVAVVVAYGAIIPPEMLAVPPHGFLNVHFSLLPRWRGAAPVARAILAGDTETGVSIMQLEAGLDTGPVLATSAVPIGSAGTGELTERLADIGAELLVQSLPGYLDGSLVPTPQDHAAATHAAKIDVADARLDLTRPAVELERVVRAMHPRPGAWIATSHGRLKVTAARVDPGAGGSAGALVVGDNGWPRLATVDGALVLSEVQPAGKRPMPGDAWARGRRGDLGTVDAD